jgi:hypothetical protein
MSRGWDTHIDAVAAAFDFEGGVQQSGAYFGVLPISIAPGCGDAAGIVEIGLISLCSLGRDIPYSALS